MPIATVSACLKDGQGLVGVIKSDYYIYKELCLTIYIYLLVMI